MSTYTGEPGELIPGLRRQAWSRQRTKGSVEREQDKDWMWVTVEGKTSAMVAYRIRADMEMRGEIRIAVPALDTVEATHEVIEVVAAWLMKAHGYTRTGGAAVALGGDVWYEHVVEPNSKRYLELRSGELRPHVSRCLDCREEITWNPSYGASNRCNRCAGMAGRAL